MLFSMAVWAQSLTVTIKLHNKDSLALVLVILPIQEKLDHIQDKYTSSFETFAFCSTEP